MEAESELKDDKSDEGGKNCYEVSGIWVHVVISSDGITVCALIFAGFIFRVFANFAFFAFLNSRLLGTVVLKYSRVKYSRIYGVSPYTIIVIRQLQRCKTAGVAV